METVKTFIPIDTYDEVTNKSDGKTDWVISGFASTPDKDFDGERVDPMGIDYEDYFQNYGWINYEHQHGIDDVVGEPIQISKSEKGLYLKAKLFKSVPKAKDIWNLQKSLKENNSNRQLGYSIEGPILQRDESDPSLIRAVLLRNVAITSHPANPNAKWQSLTKSLEIGYDVNPEAETGGAALNAGQAARALTILSNVIRRKDKDELLSGAQKQLEKSGMLDNDILSLILQIGRGLSQDDAYSMVKRLLH